MPLPLARRGVPVHACRPRRGTAVRVLGPMHAGIKAIKLYAWEEPYEQRVRAARRAERRALFNMQMVDGVNMLMFSGAPVIVAMAAFGTYSALGSRMTADVAFPALAYFDLLRFPLIMLPWQIFEAVSARVAMRRIQRFVNSEQVAAGAPSAPLRHTAPSHSVCRVRRGPLPSPSRAA
jgi:ABC-type multidrug transport system fused ATPase/permease subunit